MARKVVLTSDLSGESPARTYPFSFDGIDFEIDLTDSEAKQFRKDLSRYFDVARALNTKGIGRVRLTGFTAAQVREWAKANSVEVPSKGRLPNAVIKQFMASHRT